MAKVIEEHVKDPGSAITHFIGMLMAIFAAIPLLIKAAHEPGRIYLVSIAVYAASLILLYAASTYTLSLHDALPIWIGRASCRERVYAVAPFATINSVRSRSGRSDSRIPVCIYSETGGVFLTVTAIIAMVANNRTKSALIRALNMVSPPCLIYILLYCKSVRPGSINLEKTTPYQTICTDHIVG